MYTRGITIQSADSVAIADLVRAFNASYIDYYTPVFLTPDSFERMAERESVRLAVSAVACEGDKIVGQGLLAIRGSRGWIGGMGVLPDYRGHGIGRRLMAHLIHQGRCAGLVTIQLEVITQNDRAYALYTSMGFQTIRQLRVLVWRGNAKMLMDQAGRPGDFRITSQEPATLLTAMQPLIQVARPWQRDADGIRNISQGLSGLAIRGSDRRLAGGCIYRAEGGQVGILDVVSTTVEIGRAMLAHLITTTAAVHVSYTNVPDDDPLLPTLRETGFAETLSQYEMVLRLDQGAVQ